MIHERRVVVKWEQRVGLGPRWVKRTAEYLFSESLDDGELKARARVEFNAERRRSDDFRVYGENWKITSVEIAKQVNW